MQMLPRWRVWSVLAMVLCVRAARSVVTADDTVDPHMIVQRMASAYDGIRDYTALFFKRERIKGTLLPLEQIELHFQEPFKIYMAWRQPHAGRVVVYIEGENDDKMLVKPGGVLGFVHLTLDPTSTLAIRQAHHTIREAGLQKTIALLMREYKRGMREGQMTLSFQGYGEVDGRPAYHLVFVCHADRRSGYYAQRGALWIDSEYFLPTQISLYD